MTPDWEKASPTGERMAASRAVSGKSRVIFAVALLGIGGAIFLAVRCGEAPLPEMPRAAFRDAEVDGALAALAERTGGVAPRGDEVRLVSDLQALHAAEVAALRDEEPEERSRALYDGFRKAAAAAAAADRGRYLLLGEKLAADFGKALVPMLEAARRAGTAAVLSGDGPELARVVEAGGTFVFRAAERGLIDPRGDFRGARHLPEVLFRKRWCGAVGIPVEGTLAPAERRAELDFTAAFGADVGQRLAAIDALAALDASYDAAVARALVLHGAGRDAEARRIVEEAARTRRDDPPIEMLLDALE